MTSGKVAEKNDCPACGEGELSVAYFPSGVFDGLNYRMKVCSECGSELIDQEDLQHNRFLLIGWDF